MTFTFFLYDKREIIYISFPSICAAKFRQRWWWHLKKYNLKFSWIPGTGWIKKNTGIFSIFFCLVSPLRSKTILEHKEPLVNMSKLWHLIWQNNKNFKITRWSLASPAIMVLLHSALYITVYICGVQPADNQGSGAWWERFPVVN